ncbi:MAG TPA: hypothetical protein VFR41_14260 [Acidimicrobiia bacterium]|nr:hypothetical protein [Acidimicrobiia bacterium]
MRVFFRALFAMVVVGVVAPAALAAAPAAAATGPQLQYLGGPVLSHVVVDPVIWGRWSYGSRVPISGTRSLSSFYRGITQSRYFDWLSEYNTPTQSIGRGSFGQVYRITPSAAHDGTTVTSDDIAAELNSQIAAGHLPKPSTNRLYVVLFHANQVISTPFGNSRTTFCAYHDSIAHTSHRIDLAVIPYEVGNAGCQPASSTFTNLTTVMSHELIEAVTDPAVGLHKLAWYDQTYGEIGDICARTTPGSVTGGDGVAYVVQREWSNRRRACVLT